MPASLFSKVRVLTEAYFRLRASVLLRILDKLGDTPLEEQAKTALRSHTGSGTPRSAGGPAARGHM